MKTLSDKTHKFEGWHKVVYIGDLKKHIKSFLSKLKYEFSNEFEAKIIDKLALEEFGEEILK